MPTVFETENLDEAINIIQDENKVVQFNEKKFNEYFVDIFSDFRSFYINLISAHVKKNGQQNILRNKSVQNQYEFMFHKIHWWILFGKISLMSKVLLIFIHQLTNLFRMLPFDQLMHRCAQTVNDKYFLSPNEHYYFRALGENQRTDIANLE